MKNRITIIKKIVLGLYVLSIIYTAHAAEEAVSYTRSVQFNTNDLQYRHQIAFIKELEHLLNNELLRASAAHNNPLNIPKLMSTKEEPAKNSVEESIGWAEWAAQQGKTMLGLPSIKNKELAQPMKRVNIFAKALKQRYTQIIAEAPRNKRFNNWLINNKDTFQQALYQIEFAINELYGALLSIEDRKYISFWDQFDAALTFINTYGYTKNREEVEFLVNSIIPDILMDHKRLEMGQYGRIAHEYIEKLFAINTNDIKESANTILATPWATALKIAHDHDNKNPESKTIGQYMLQKDTANAIHINVYTLTQLYLCKVALQELITFISTLSMHS